MFVGAFIAWTPSLSSLAGVGSTEERALTKFADELRMAVQRTGVPIGDLGIGSQLLAAARRFDSERLLDYVRELAAPIELATAYEPAPN